tara:strand:- start:71 stop:868 length:798 start_codon:yes stop_codon:yes gene_type:complete
VSRLQSKLEECKARSRKALISFITAGDPTTEHTIPALHALVRGGVDVIELGIPFSDPEAEGPSIQKSSQRALENGVGLESVLQMVQEFREKDSETPIVLMGYLNSVLSMADFAEKASNSGVDGLIVVNLPPEEAEDLQSSLRRNDIDLIYLLAPTTTEKRSVLIAEKASGFLYYVSLKGITGAGHIEVDEVASRIESLRGMTDLPLCVGFGIKNAKTATEIGKFSDGVVVGSALVDLMSESEDVDLTAKELESAVSLIRQGLDSI